MMRTSSFVDIKICWIHKFENVTLIAKDTTHAKGNIHFEGVKTIVGHLIMVIT